MQTSIFKRYLAITMVIILLSFTMLGTVTLVFFGRYWRQEKKDLLTQNATSIAQTASRFLWEKSEGKYELQGEPLMQFMESFSTSIDADIFITDLDGNVLLGSYACSKVKGIDTAPLPLVEKASGGLYEGRGRFGGLYRENYYIIAVPMAATEGGPQVGAVFATTSPASMNSIQLEAFKIFLVAAGLALLITFCVVGVFAYRLVRPLRLMSAAARSLETTLSISSPIYPASVREVASAIANGTSRSFASVLTRKVLPLPVGPIIRILDFSISTPSERSAITRL